MAKLEVVITADGEGWYLSDGENETGESVSWGDVLEFNGVLYRADVSDDGDDVSLFKVIAMSESEYEAVSEPDDDDDSDEDESDEDEAEEVGA